MYYSNLAEFMHTVTAKVRQTFHVKVSTNITRGHGVTLLNQLAIKQYDKNNIAEENNGLILLIFGSTVLAECLDYYMITKKAKAVDSFQYMIFQAHHGPLEEYN